MKFQEKLKHFRTEHDLTQLQLAELCNLSRTTITELETGRKKPSLKLLEKISKALNTDVTYWLDTDSDEFKISNFEGLELIIKKLIETGDIKTDGSLTEKANTLLLQVLEAEIKLLLKKS